MNTKSIQDFILNSERNLHIAAVINEVWLEARKRSVSKFLEKLELIFKKKKGGRWICKKNGEFFEELESNVQFYKPLWEDYQVELHFGNYGKIMSFGVARNEKIHKKPHHSEILTAIKKEYPSALGGSKWWEANITMMSPATDWQKPKNLWRMRNDKKFLYDVTYQLLEVATIAEPIIDSLVRKK